MRGADESRKRCAKDDARRTTHDTRAVPKAPLPGGELKQMQLLISGAGMESEKLHNCIIPIAGSQKLPSLGAERKKMIRWIILAKEPDFREGLW
jgi:hypothetical protein